MLWGTRNYLVQLVESFVYFIYFVYLSFLVYYETLQAENGEGRVRGVRSRFPSLFTSPSGLKRPTPLSRHFSFLLELFQFAKTNPGENCACNYWTWTLPRFIYINQQNTLKLKCTNIVNRIPSIYSKWTLESTRNWNCLSLVVSLLCIKN